MFKTIKCSLSEKQMFYYLEYAKLYVHNGNVVVEQQKQTNILPVASISSIIVGNGVSITHDVFVVCAKYNCIINFVANNCLKYYASCLCPTHNNYNLLKQIDCYANKNKRLEIVKKMMYSRFKEINLDDKSINQIIGIEAVKTKQIYKFFAKKY